MLIPLFGNGIQSKSATVTAQDRINVFVELPKDPEKGQVAIHGFPGLVEYVDIDGQDESFWASGPSIYRAGPVRAMTSVPFAVNGQPSEYLLFWKGGWAYGIDPDGVLRLSNNAMLTAGGFSSSEARVDTCMFSEAGVAFVFAADGDGVGNYAFMDTSVGFPVGMSPILDADAQQWRSCAYLASRLIGSVANSSQFYYSETGNILAWDPLDFQSAESIPDDILRLWSSGGTLIAFGARAIEFFTPSGDADTPFAPVRGAANDWGLYAVWSVAMCGGSLVFLARNGHGQAQVVRLVGYSVQVVSDPEIETLINELPGVENATALSYTIAGHTFYQLNFTEGNRSFLFDVTTGVWSRLTDENGDRHRAEIAASFNGTTVVSDYETGRLYTLDDGTYTTDGNEHPREITSRHFFKDFDRVIVDELVVDFDVGLGSEAGSDPQVMLQISKDNGKSWGTELWKSLGKIGETRTRVVWRRLGQGRDWTFRLRVTDPVRFVIAAAAINAQPVIG